MKMVPFFLYLMIYTYLLLYFAITLARFVYFNLHNLLSHKIIPLKNNGKTLNYFYKIIAQSLATGDHSPL